MSYTIYGARGSGSLIIEMACAHLGVDYQIHDLDVRADQHKGEAYLALNPLGKMPTLRTSEGEVITESIAILLSLDERHRDGNLLPPPGSPARARALRWMLYLVAEMYLLVEILDYPERFAPTPDQAAPLKARVNELWRERWKIVHKNLEGSPYLLPEGFCGADLCIAALGRWLEEDWRREHVPKVDALIEAIRRQPKVGDVWARHYGP